MRNRLTLTLPSITAKRGAVHLEPGAGTIPVADIRPRRGDDSRPLAALHVVTLVESIAALGLLEPIVVDTQGYLLAGGHRLAALQLLAEQQPIARRNRFLASCGHPTTDGAPTGELANLADRVAMADNGAFTKRYADTTVPVQVVDVTGKGGADLALAIEAAENTVRRQYTRDEVEALALRFKKAGYKAQVTGRPKKGERTVMTALEAALGRSKRQIQRILRGEDRGHSEWDRACAAIHRAAKKLVKAKPQGRSGKAVTLLKAADLILKAFETGSE